VRGVDEGDAELDRAEQDAPGFGRVARLADDSGPVIRIPPNPSRATSTTPPRRNVPAAAAVPSPSTRAIVGW
jgi:hypothetical protein